MDAILHTFGIDWRLLVINMVNFGLLMLALWYFLYGPVTRMLEERRKAVVKGVEDAQKAEQTLREIDESKKGVLAEAGREAETLVAKARAAAAEKEQELVARAQASAESLLSDAQRRAEELKHEALEESRKEVAKLVVLGVEKAMQK